MTFSDVQAGVAARPPRTLRERTEAWLHTLDVLVLPVLYEIPITIPPVIGDWAQFTFRFPRAEGPLVLCGLIDTFLLAQSALVDMRLSIGDRRVLNEVDMAAIVQHPIAYSTERTEWGRPLILAPGELVTLELRVDPNNPGRSPGNTLDVYTGALQLSAFHTTAHGADMLLQQDELWAHTFRLTSSPGVPLATGEFIAPAGGPIALDALLTPAPGSIDMALAIQVGNVQLTPQGLGTPPGMSTTGDDMGSLSGLELRPDEVISVKQTVGTAFTQRITILGRRGRNAAHG